MPKNPLIIIGSKLGPDLIRHEDNHENECAPPIPSATDNGTFAAVVPEPIQEKHAPAKAGWAPVDLGL